MSRVKILCNCDIGHLPEVKKRLASVGSVTYSSCGYRELSSRLAGYDVFIPSLNVRLDASLLHRAEGLKLIATPSTGTDHIDLEEAKRLGITVISLKDEYEFLKNVSATAELAFGLLLALVRHIPSAFESVCDGSWGNGEFRGRELDGKTMGIIGYGRLGEKVSRYAHAFGLQVIACDPYRRVKDSWVRQVRLGTLLAKSDIISVHVHLNGETRRMIGAKEFARMKPGVYIVNTSRGAVIDEQELLKALKTGWVAGAAQDVLADELGGKIKNNPLVRYARTADNLIITPHLGGVTLESQRKAYTFLVRKIVDYIRRRSSVPT